MGHCRLIWNGAAMAGSQGELQYAQFQDAAAEGTVV
jgi:hypothetical protein